LQTQYFTIYSIKPKLWRDKDFPFLKLSFFLHFVLGLTLTSHVYSNVERRGVKLQGM